MQPRLEQCIRRILIADDQPGFRLFLRQVLAHLAAEVIECADGIEAVAAFERHQPDWAVLDWMMPNLDGVAAARSIRARHPQARIVVISVGFTPLLAKEAAAAGPAPVYPKNACKICRPSCALRRPHGARPTHLGKKTLFKRGHFTHLKLTNPHKPKQ